MRRLVVLLAGVAAGVGLLTASGGGAATASPGTAEEAQIPLAFKVQGSHGYTISVSGFPATPLAGFEHPMVTLIVRRGAASVFYTAHAKVTADSIDADLGPLGRVDLRLNRSGREKTIEVKCSHAKETYEAGTYEGIFEFRGDGGYTRARANRLAGLPLVALASGKYCGDRNSAESRGPREPGARLAGVSYADGRVLEFQVNKNHPDGTTLFSASLTERLDGVRIHRDVAGIATASAFRYNGDLKSAVLSPPAPFSGSASLRYDKNSASPLFTGNLRLAFPGRTVRIAGPDVHVSLVHAHLKRGHGPTVTIGG